MLHPQLLVHRRSVVAVRPRSSTSPLSQAVAFAHTRLLVVDGAVISYWLPEQLESGLHIRTVVEVARCDSYCQLVHCSTVVVLVELEVVVELLVVLDEDEVVEEDVVVELVIS